MNKRSSFMKVYIIPCFAATFIMAIFLLTFSVNVYASSSADGFLPYKFSSIKTYNSFIEDSIIDKLRDSNLPVDSDDYVLMFSDHSAFTQYPQYNNQYDVAYYFFLLPIDDFSSFSSGYNFYNNNLGVNLISGNYYYISVICDYTSTFDLISVRTPSYTVYSTSLYQSGMFGHVPSVDSVSGFTFTPFSPCYFNIDFYSSNDDLVLDFNESPIINIGHATEPDSFDDPVYNTGHAKPTSVPQLTINNYTWTTPPTPDFSTLEDIAESIYNYLSWLGSNLIGQFSNLINNLGNIGNYIGSTIQYYGNLIISNIQNGIKNFYDNMVSLFEPIGEVVNKIGVIAATIVALGSDENGVFSIPVLTQTLFLPDQESVQEIIEANDSLHISSTIDIFVDKVWVSENSIIKTLHNVTPSKKFHIPSCIYHGVQIGDFDIDFSWFETYKSYSDIVIGSFLSISWVYWFFVSCSHLLRYGKSYEFENGDGDHQRGIFF